VPTVYIIIFMDKPYQNLPPRLPVVVPAIMGKYNLKKMGPIEMISEGARKFGDIFRVKILHRNIIFLVGPRAHKVFMEPNDSVVSAREVYRFTVPVFGPNIVYDAPEKVMQQQLKFVSKGLTGQAMLAHCAKIVEETEQYFSAWPDEGEIDLFHAFAELVIFTACRCLLGAEFRKRVGKEFAPLYQDLSDGMNHLSFFFPYFPTAKHRARDIAREKISCLFKEAIRERRESKDNHDDYLQVLIDARYADGSAANDDAIVGLLLAALFAGQHTSSITSTWTGIHIIKDKAKIVPRLLEEQHKVLSQHGYEINLDALAEMELLNACMKEALRLHPPLIILLRKVKQEQVYKGFLIPKDEVVAVSPVVAHRQKDVFVKPDEYDPDRFLAPREEDKKEKYSFIAFGGGRHGCLGERFAFVQVKTIWSTLLRKYDFELLNSELPETDFDNIVAGPRPPCMARFRKRVASKQ